MSKQQRVEAVDRALTILGSFTSHGEELTLAAISERTGFYKSTILRLIGSLQHFGYLVRQSNGTYRLGAELWRLGALYQKDYLSAATIRPILHELRAFSGETASFYVRDGDQRVCLYRLNSDKPIRHHLEEGVRLPLGRGAAGRLISAYTGSDSRDKARIRQAGHVVSLGERDAEVAAIAIPVFTEDKQFAGALALSGLVDRFDDETQKRYCKGMKKIVRKHMHRA